VTDERQNGTWQSFIYRRRATSEEVWIGGWCLKIYLRKKVSNSFEEYIRLANVFGRCEYGPWAATRYVNAEVLFTWSE